MSGKPGMSREHKLAKSLGIAYESGRERQERLARDEAPRGRPRKIVEYKPSEPENVPAPIKEDVKEPSYNPDLALIREIDDDSTTDFEEPPVENSLVELRNLINKKDIDVKTILSSEQILVIHKIDTVERVFREYGNDLPEEERREALKCASLCKLYTNRFFELSINNGGISRKQYLEGVHKSEEREVSGNKLSLDSPVVRVN